MVKVAVKHELLTIELELTDENPPTEPRRIILQAMREKYEALMIKLG